MTELARNIEAQVWTIFNIMDILYEDLAMQDSYYRITRSSPKHTNAGIVKAKSIEYLESIIRREHAGLLAIVESIRFENGYCKGVEPIAGETRSIVEVYERIIRSKDYWLIVASMLDMPPFLLDTLGSNFMKGFQDMMSLLEKCQILKNSPGLEGWTLMEMMLLAELSQEVNFEAGTVVFDIGDTGDAVYGIVEGCTEVIDKAGKRVSYLKAPNGFGFRGALDNSQRRYAVKCTEDSRMLKIGSEDFQDFLENNPRLYKKLFHYLLSYNEDDVYKFG